MESLPKSGGELWGALGFPHSCLSYYYRKQVIHQEKISTESFAVLLQLEVWKSRTELQQLPLPQVQECGCRCEDGGIGASSHLVPVCCLLLIQQEQGTHQSLVLYQPCSPAWVPETNAQGGS